MALQEIKRRLPQDVAYGVSTASDHDAELADIIFDHVARVIRRQRREILDRDRQH
jgi:hypothetical protein